MAYFEWFWLILGPLRPISRPAERPGGGAKCVTWWPRPPRGHNSRTTGPISKILTVLKMAWPRRQSRGLRASKMRSERYPLKNATRRNATHPHVIYIQTSVSAYWSKLARLDLDILSLRAFIGKKLIFQFPAYFFGLGLGRYARSLWLKFNVWAPQSW